VIVARNDSKLDNSTKSIEQLLGRVSNQAEKVKCIELIEYLVNSNLS
jgi:short-subunit dehydrogenase involved in D-alanine esterification of teichoic acids